MIAVLLASDFDARFQRVTGILEKQGIPYKAYGGTGVWEGLMTKLEVAHQAATELTDYEHILFLDAYDIVVLDGPEAIMERYREFKHPWVCNAEPHIFPPNSFQPEDYPPCDTVWPYLNSGAYLAERAYMKECFDRWTKDGMPSHQSNNDQPWLAARFLEEPGVIKLDTGCKLFQCLIGGWWAFETEYGRLHNKVTQTNPLILHHNGGGDISEERVSRLWRK